KPGLTIQNEAEAYFFDLWVQSFGPFARYLEQASLKGETISPQLFYTGFYIDPKAADAFCDLPTRHGPRKPHFVQMFTPPGSSP
ncbi:MAG: hypothetical protein AB7E52_03470, partial [Bdellovibrionales bacterium]